MKRSMIYLLVFFSLSQFAWARKPAVEPVSAIPLGDIKTTKASPNHYFDFTKDVKAVQINDQKRAYTTKDRLSGRSPAIEHDRGTNSWTGFFTLLALLTLPLAIRYLLFEKYKSVSSQKETQVVEVENVIPFKKKTKEDQHDIDSDDDKFTKAS